MLKNQILLATVLEGSFFHLGHKDKLFKIESAPFLFSNSQATLQLSKDEIKRNIEYV